jgi:hypothetical protein
MISKKSKKPPPPAPVVKVDPIIQIRPDVLELEKQHAILRKPLKNEDLIIDHFAIQRMPRDKMVVH